MSDTRTRKQVPPRTGRLWTAAELAALYGVTAATVSEWAKIGRIPSISINRRTRRFDPEAVRAALEGVATGRGATAQP